MRRRVGRRRGQKQHDGHSVAERAEKGAQQTLALFALKKVFAVALETGLRLRFGQSGGRAAEIAEDCLRRLVIERHIEFPFYIYKA